MGAMLGAFRRIAPSVLRELECLGAARLQFACARRELLAPIRCAIFRVEISEYLLPKTLKETIEVVGFYTGRGPVVAGGTDVFSELSKSKKATAVVDISNITDLKYVERNDRFIRIGATRTLSALLNTNWLSEEVPGLAEAARAVGSPQIRNQGTVVGNILTGRAVAAVRVCATSIGAFLEVKGPNHDRLVTLEDLGKTKTVKPEEVVVSLVIPASAGARNSIYRQFAPRKGLCFSSACACASATVEERKFAKSIEPSTTGFGKIGSGYL